MHSPRNLLCLSKLNGLKHSYTTTGINIYNNACYNIYIYVYMLRLYNKTYVYSIIFLYTSKVVYKTLCNTLYNDTSILSYVIYNTSTFTLFA